MSSILHTCTQLHIVGYCAKSRYEYIGVKRQKLDVCYVKVFISTPRKQTTLKLLCYALKSIQRCVNGWIQL